MRIRDIFNNPCKYYNMLNNVSSKLYFYNIDKLIIIYNHYICFSSHVDFWSFRIPNWELNGRVPTRLLVTITHISEGEAYLMIVIFWFRSTPPIHNAEDKYQRRPPHLKKLVVYLLPALLESKFPCSLEEKLLKDRTTRNVLYL